jgi:hypothetical protein
MHQLVPAPLVLGVKPCFGYFGCQVNEMVSLVERHIRPTLPVTDQTRAIYARAFQRMWQLYPPKQLVPYTEQQVINESPQNRKERIRQAYRYLKEYGEPPDFARVNCFIKYEKGEDSVDKPPEMKPPRLISYRKPPYCYTLARYMKPLERRIFYMRQGRNVPKREREFVKGLDSWQVAESLRHMSRRFPNPVWVLADHEKYDASLNDCLRSHFRQYAQAHYPKSSDVRRLLRLQRRNKCRTKGGIQFEVQGTMLSGEYITSLEDSFDNGALIKEWLHSIDHEMRVNGDDSVVCLDASDLQRLDMDFWRKAGFVTKIEIVYDFSMVEFCQCKPVRVGGRWRMVRKPGRVLARTAYTCKTFPNNSGYLKLLGSIGLGELHCNTGVPILQSWAQLLIRSSQGQFSEALYAEYMVRRHERTDVSRPITVQARVDFDVAFGISSTQQIALERWFDSVESLPVLAQVSASAVP